MTYRCGFERGRREVVDWCLLLSAQLIVLSLLAGAFLGLPAWFPWSVPSLLSVVAGPEQAGPEPLSIAAVVVVRAAASAATVIWWERAYHDW